MEALLEKLGHELVNSPYLSVMILNRKYQIIWHNQRFADEMNEGKSLVGMPCFQAVGSQKVHANCPTQQSIETGKSSMACLDQGDVNFLYMTIPLDEEHAAKVHVFLPKQQAEA
ncbi:MAG: hypothetical protein ACOX2K_10405 [Bacillota bacterium]|jgi:c-di-AMP phosphodiesterase-like protein